MLLRPNNCLSSAGLAVTSASRRASIGDSLAAFCRATLYDRRRFVPEGQPVTDRLDRMPRLLSGGAGTSATDRGTRARAIADSFADQFPPTMPPPASESVPSAGRHARVTAETAGQVYVGGHTFDRDACGRITARSAGMPTGWSLRLSVLDVAVVACNPENPGSRADPVVLRAQRQMGDPSIAAALAGTLRQYIPGRNVQAQTQSYFIQGGIVFLREASVVLPLPETSADDPRLVRQLTLAAAASLSEANPVDDLEPVAPPPARRGHLRLIQ